MKIFIDCGTNDCSGFGHFVGHLGIDDTWTAYSFEANPEWISNCLPNGVNFLNQAVWVSDGIVKFRRYGSEGKSAGSLVSDTGGGSHYCDLHDEIDVVSIDFHAFISQFGKDDEIYIKMDIEHAEYDVIEDMIKKGWPENIREMWVEWHAVDPITNDESFKARKKKIMECLVDSKTAIHDWQ